MRHTTSLIQAAAPGTPPSSELPSPHRRQLMGLGLLLGSGLSACGGDPAGPVTSSDASLKVEVSGAASGDPSESIAVRKIGKGSRHMVLVPGNNTSGQSFSALFDALAATPYFDAFTLWAPDYRGSGASSYRKAITGLKDFAQDFDKALTQLGLPNENVVLVGYSLGFGVALEMHLISPNRYSHLVGLAPIGTRGIRVNFNASQAGTDDFGTSWSAGDYVPIGNDTRGIAATAFQQRSWQGLNRNEGTVKFTWDLVVFNDVLKYQLAQFKAADDATFQLGAVYRQVIQDVLNIQYMPESLYFAHKFNLSNASGMPASYQANHDGTVVTVPGNGRLGNTLANKKVLLVKAQTDFANWRGDLVISDNYIATSKYDLKAAGASQVMALMIAPDQRFDHGFPIAMPSATAKVLQTFLQGSTLETDYTTALGGVTAKLYPHGETSFETNTFTGA